MKILFYIQLSPMKNRRCLLEEYFDLLDEFGQKLGQRKERSLVHKDGNFHRSVHIWIYNDKKEILFQRRCAFKDLGSNRLDMSCGGHLNAGETSIEAALRELKEELNLTIDPKELHYVMTVKRIFEKGQVKDREFNDVYLLKTTKTLSEFKMQKEELSELMFLSVEQWERLLKYQSKDFLPYPIEQNFLIYYLKTKEKSYAA